MAQRGLTALLDRHHDKLNQHTAQIKQIEEQLTTLQASVNTLEQQTAHSDEESSGLRAGLREWIDSIKELM